jgi:hypothetical protein
MRLVAFIDDERTTRRILAHLGLPARAPPRGHRRRGQQLLQLEVAPSDLDGIDRPVLAETSIREFSDESAAHERSSLARLGRRHKLESVGQLLHG